MNEYPSTSATQELAATLVIPPGSYLGSYFDPSVESLPNIGFLTPTPIFLNVKI